MGSLALQLIMTCLAAGKQLVRTPFVLLVCSLALSAPPEGLTLQSTNAGLIFSS